MNKRGIILVSIFSLTLIFFVTTEGLAKDIRGVTDETIKVGWIGDLTGPASSLFVCYLQAIRNYFRNVNEQDGINGRKVKLIVEDDRYTIPGSLAAYKKLFFRDRVLAILGMGGSGQHKTLYSRIEKDKIPVITVSASWHVSKPFKRYSFQPTNDASDEIKLMVDYLMNVKKVKKVKDLRLAYVYADNEAGKMAFHQLKKSMNHYGLKILGTEVVNFGDIDASTQVLSLKRVKADHVIFITVGSGAFSLLRDARKLEYYPTFLSSFHAIGEDIVKITGAGAKKLISVAAYGSWYDKKPGISQLKEVTLKYYPDRVHAEKYGTHRYYTKGWLTALILAEGAKRAGTDLNGETLVAGLENLKGFSTGGISPPLTYGPDRRKATDSGKFYRADLDKEHFMPMTDWMRPAH